jgi:hypothetical protein
MIKNNNPGNIRTSNDKWLGKIGADQRGFVIFDTLPHGYRALYKLLMGYIGKGYNTIDKIINKWAPPSENDTTNYINFVVKQTGIDRYQTVKSTDLYIIGMAISKMEHGLFDKDAAQQGLAMVYRSDQPTTSNGSANIGLLWPVLIIVGIGLLLHKG